MEFPSAPPPVSPPLADGFLELLVRIANSQKEFSPGLTLFVGGSTISGRLASGAEYFDWFASTMADSMSDAAARASTREYFLSIGQASFGPWNEAPLAPPSPRDHHHFIHLKGARVFHPGAPPLPVNQGVWLRARLSAIDGFALGLLSERAP